MPLWVKEGSMARYFTREEAEAFLPAISIVLRKIQAQRQSIRGVQEEIDALRAQSMGNGHHLHERISTMQHGLAARVQELRALIEELQSFGCELKDQDMGLIDFLSLRNGREVYLCWHLGEDGIRFWHELHTGYSGRQPL